MFHALGILHSRSRHINFSVSLHILLAMILLVVPLVQCMLLTYRSRGKILPLRLGSVLIDPLESSTVSTAPRTPSIPFTSRLLISLVPFGLYCFLWTRIPPYVTALPPVASVLPNPIELDPHLDPSSTRPTFMDGAIVDWTSGPEGWEGSGWLASSLGRVIVLGVVVLGALSGFGAVRTAWGFFEHAAGASR
jgi:hypothetical protein